MSIHYMRSSIYGLNIPVAITPTRLNHEDEDPSLHILAHNQNHQPQQRFRQLRHERPISSASSRSNTASKRMSMSTLSFTSILEKKAKHLLSQLSHGNSNGSNSGRNTPTQHTHEDKRISRTFNYIRHGTFNPEYIPIDVDVDVQKPMVAQRDRRAAVRTSVYSSHCLVSGNAPRRSSRYFQI